MNKKRTKITRRKRRHGGRLSLTKARSILGDRYQVNNHVIPDKVAINRFLLNELYGKDGKIISLPYPGEIFSATTSGTETNSAKNFWVCVQSCISTLDNDLDSISKIIIDNTASSNHNTCGNSLFYNGFYNNS